jgi:hypothetical protein
MDELLNDAQELKELLESRQLRWETIVVERLVKELVKKEDNK